MGTETGIKHYYYNKSTIRENRAFNLNILLKRPPAIEESSLLSTTPVPDDLPTELFKSMADKIAPLVQRMLLEVAQDSFIHP